MIRFKQLRPMRLIKGFSTLSAEKGLEYIMANDDGNCMYYCVDMCIKNSTRSTMAGQKRQRQNALRMISKYPMLKNHKFFTHDGTSWASKLKDIKTNGSHGGIFALIWLSIYHRVLFQVMDVALSTKQAYKYWPFNAMADVFAGKNIKAYTLLQYPNHYDLLRCSCPSDDDEYEDISEKDWVDLWIQALDVWNRNS